MMGTVDIKYTYDHHDKNNICIENMYHGLLETVDIRDIVSAKSVPARKRSRKNCHFV